MGCRPSASAIPHRAASICLELDLCVQGSGGPGEVQEEVGGGGGSEALGDVWMRPTFLFGRRHTASLLAHTVEAERREGRDQVERQSGQGRDARPREEEVPVPAGARLVAAANPRRR